MKTLDDRFECKWRRRIMGPLYADPSAMPRKYTIRKWASNFLMLIPCGRPPFGFGIPFQSSRCVSFASRARVTRTRSKDHISFENRVTDSEACKILIDASEIYAQHRPYDSNEKTISVTNHAFAFERPMP